MALTATLRRFEITLSDTDRGVYETLDWRVAQHPSETLRYLVARVIARALEHAEGLEFTQGLASDEEPALWQKNLRGELEAWVEVGSPSPERIHRASKSVPRVVIYAWSRPDELARAMRGFNNGKGVHRCDALTLIALPQAFLDEVSNTVDRQNRWELSVSGGGLYLTVGGKLYEGSAERVS
ncbi:MAG: YaeQ family protein [Myxococcales bacterium]|nr:YaeQ family protein [Myxococcales bacterium]